ncbi:MAG TPA: hypothetical protein VII56_14125 [Rhizomicrobium sp.]
MRAILMGAVFAVAAAAPALAGDEVLASRFGNTTITKDAAGTENHVYYNADHTFTGKQGANGFKGTWKIDGGTICLTADPAIPNTPNPACAPVSNHKIGDTWTAGPFTVSLVAGIQ